MDIDKKREGFELSAPQISFIVPIYNVEPYLNQCIQSLVNQTRRDIEVILVNDGSTDNCPKICDHYRAEYPDLVRVIHQDNQGTSSARNIGLHAATGEYVAFVDGDDWVETAFAERMLLYANKRGADIVIGTHYTEYQKNTEFLNFDCLDGFCFSQIDKTRLFRQVFYLTGIGGGTKELNAGVCWGKIYRRSMLKALGFLMDTMCQCSEDAIFNLYAFNAARVIVITNNPVAHYRNISESLSHRFRTDGFEIANKIRIHLLKFLENHVQPEEQEEIRNTWTAHMTFDALKRSVSTSLNLRCIIREYVMIRREMHDADIVRAVRDVKPHNLHRKYRIVARLLKARSLIIVYLLIKAGLRWRNWKSY